MNKGKWICSECGNTEYKEREITCWNCGKGDMNYTRNTMNTYTDAQLKQALAKILPEKVCFKDNNLYHGAVIYHAVLIDGEQIYSKPVLDTELLHLCWLVEETLTRLQCTNYSEELLTCHPEVATKADEFFWHFTWQQRTIALAKMKGIEIV